MNIKTKTFENITYTSLAKFITFCLSAVANIVLARYLVSEDYGIVSFAMIFTNFMAQFSDFGLSSAVIRKRDLSDHDLYVGYTLMLFLNILIFAITIAIAPITTFFIDNTEVTAVVRISSLGFIIWTFAFMPSCLLRRELNFKKLIIPNIGATILSTTVSIIMAINGYKYWSLVVGTLAGAITFITIINMIKPVELKIRLKKETAYEYLQFGGNLFLAGLIVFVIYNADNFLIGTLSGATILGFYALAFNWGSMITFILNTTVNNVLFPTFSKLQNNQDSLIGAYLQVLRYVSFIAVLVNIGLFLVADEFLFIILGSNTAKWMPALSALKILCIYGIIRAIIEPITNVLLADGQTRLIFRSILTVSFVELLLLYPAVQYYGIDGAAVVVTISYALQCFIYFPYMKRRYDLPYARVWKTMEPSIITGTLVIVITSILALYTENTMVFLVGKIFFISVVYLLLYGLITKWRIYSEIKLLIGETKAI